MDMDQIQRLSQRALLRFRNPIMKLRAMLTTICRSDLASSPLAAGVGRGAVFTPGAKRFAFPRPMPPSNGGEGVGAASLHRVCPYAFVVQIAFP